MCNVAVSHNPIQRLVVNTNKHAFEFWCADSTENYIHLFCTNMYKKHWDHEMMTVDAYKL